MTPADAGRSPGGRGANPIGLPVDEVLGAVGSAARAGGVVLTAPTGSGKTTRVPPHLLDLLGGEVWLLEPRRIAARAAARRIAEERGGRVGGEVGYAVRDERVGGSGTRLWCVTEGVLLRRLVEDPWLAGVRAVVFDEFHERRLESDLALALCRRVRAELRPDLVIAVLSATLEAEPVAAYLGAPITTSAGRAHPVEVRHLPRFGGEPMEAALARALEWELSQRAAGQGGVDPSGDVLVFLAGVGEIRRARTALSPLLQRAGFEVRELYGELAAAQQDSLFEPGSKPRCILATNVAETSLTLPRVATVIDSGEVRRLVLDPRTGLDRLELGTVSLASAEQRAGRAGRTGPGRALRLWSELEQRALSPRETPAVLAQDLSGAILQLIAFGEPDPTAFPWFEAPQADALEASLALLERLRAVERSARAARLTERGRALAPLPLSPRLGVLLLEGARLGVGREAALAAALLSERDPFRRAARDAGRNPFADALDSDVEERVERLLDAERGQRDDGDRGAVEAILRSAKRLEAWVPRGSARASGRERSAALARALLAAFPDRVARRRERGSPRARLLGGRGVELARESRVSEAEWFLALDVDSAPRAGSPDGLVRLAAGLEPEWLDPREFSERVDVRLDEGRGRVVGVAQRCYGDLVWEERAVPPDRDRAAELLAQEVRRDPARRLRLDREDVAHFLGRVAFLAAHCPEAQWPEMEPRAIADRVEPYLLGALSFEDLLALPLLDLLEGALDRTQRALLEREAPSHWTVPAGRRVRIEYPPGRTPFFEARIQELFGLRETPRLARGKVALLVHLLAPNGRPQQVTDDLASFWARTYPLVRKELRARYPRHAWPEDPTTAAPSSRPKPRGS